MGVEFEMVAYFSSKSNNKIPWEMKKKSNDWVKFYMCNDE